ncbi:D-psicose/D-tagatose/L-ribulose 3-epimerase [Palleronia aestuarii]|uniref:D-psicose/D-tagatose/L-ribulose 3-epimerase n=1 Tax=Palleronia aestuarii TaxID=568105 RepID=A0A2W7NR37_9RHOB|nr:sugar phosphate isomerase/epimerase [Palleronia aestuarii]PZX13762.1 D-psicose/D-tagatose/L-ribulose 3-epimerase [Palleronia aestuarii]
MRRLGIHSFVWTDGQTQEGLEFALRKTAEHGYRMIEFAYLKADEFDLDRLSKLARENDIEITVTMGLPADADVSSTDRESVARGKEILRKAVGSVRDIGGVRLGGILFSKHGKYESMPTADGWKHSVEAVAETAEHAKEAGIQIALEVVNRFESNLLNTTAQGLKFLKDTGRDDVKLHLDSFHMNIEEPDPAGAIRLAGDKIGYYHIGENYRGFLGTGTVDFPAVFSALVDIGFDQDITFESFSKAIVDESLCYACGIWRDTWTENDPLAAHARTFIEEKWREAEMRAKSRAAA